MKIPPYKLSLSLFFEITPKIVKKCRSAEKSRKYKNKLEILRECRMFVLRILKIENLSGYSSRRCHKLINCMRVIKNINGFVQTSLINNNNIQKTVRHERNKTQFTRNCVN